MESSAIVIPLLPDGTIFWLSALLMEEGQTVQKGQPVARLENQAGRDFCEEIYSPADGYVVGLHALAGQILHPGEILCYICSQPSVALVRPGPRAGLAPEVGFDPAALIVFGGGGHGKSVIELVQAMSAYRVVGVVDDQLAQGGDVLGVPVLGGADVLEEWFSRGIRLAVNGVGGIGNVSVRLKIFDLLSRAGFHFPALVHPSAVVERSAVIEAGAQVFAQCYVGSAARIGFGSVLNTGVIVSHDCVLGEVVNLSPGATLAGNVRVQKHAQIGMRATVNLQITVGEGAMLGNGCTVKADVPPNTRIWAGSIWPQPKKQ
jgi:sugar O-acyltransferase (sialic acid O-acetyltransferase NeuD family)